MDVQTNAGLFKQSLKAAVVAAYVGALISFLIFQVWRYQTGADASICPVGPQDLTDWCTVGELSLAFLFDFLWALYGTPLALVITLPCAVALGSLAPQFESRLRGRALSFVQYGLAAGLGLAVGLIFQAVAEGVIAAFAGAWTFRRARYFHRSSQKHAVTTDLAG